jgi:hypothetical protein
VSTLKFAVEVIMLLASDDRITQMAADIRAR